MFALFGGPLFSAALKPNFLVILSDNLGKDWFSCYGADGGHTPEIDRLAAGGVRFKHCYVTPLCSTTRVQMLTGRYGFRTGWSRHHDAAIYGGGGFDWKRETTWARALRDAGYATCITGKWQINDLYDQTEALKQLGSMSIWCGRRHGRRGRRRGPWKRPSRMAEAASRSATGPCLFRNGEHMREGQVWARVYLDYLVEVHGGIVRPALRGLLPVPSRTFHRATRLVPGKEANAREQFPAWCSLDARWAAREGNGTPRPPRQYDHSINVGQRPSSICRAASVESPRWVAWHASENGIDVPLVVNCPAAAFAGHVVKHWGAAMCFQL